MPKFYNAVGASADVPATTFRKNGFYGKIAASKNTQANDASRLAVARQGVPPVPNLGGRQAPNLGRYAKSSPPPLFSPSAGATPGPQGVAKSVATGGADSAAGPSPELRKKLQATRAERYALQATARRIVSAAGKRAGLQYGHDYHRVAKCKHIVHGSEGVGVHASQEHGSAFFSNLVTCGSISACPVCAAKISERRREEISQAVSWAYANSLQPVMVTLTFPHRAWHKLRTLLKQQAHALELLRKGKQWDKFKKRVCFRGLIRALECTHGVNGWHPHTHELWFVAKDVQGPELHAEVLKKWMSACSRAGLLDLSDARQVAFFKAHAVDVKPNCSASDYLSKQDDSKHWGVDRELASASTKDGRLKGFHPFGLLALASAGDVRAERLYLAYILAFKGKRLLLWSPGLKAQVGVDELTDETLAEQQRDKADLLGRLTNDDWRTVREAGKRAAVLDAVENGGWTAVVALLERLTLDAIERLEAQIAALGVP